MSGPLHGRAALGVAADLLREARSRKWFLAVGGAITLLLVVLGLSLRLDVVDGALAATRFFGKDLGSAIGGVDVIFRALYRAVAYTIFYGGSVFGILACADFAPSLLSPGRIEHLLSLPVRRWELLLGTFLGVFAIAVLGALYGASGLVVLLGVKSGFWSFRPLWAALLAGAGFATVYAAMLTSALFVRSAALSAAVGGILFGLGVVASYRAHLTRMFEPGLGRTAFRAVTAVLPRIATLADAAAQIAATGTFDHRALGNLLGGMAFFTASVLGVGIWRFDRKDF